MNEFFLAKLIWRLFNDLGEWKDIQNNKYNLENNCLHKFLLSEDVQGGLAIWRYAQNNKQSIKTWVRWKVGNGKTIEFCDDIWLLDHPLRSDQRWGGFMMQCKTTFGSLISYYQDAENWLDLAMVDISLKDLNKILNVVFLANVEDSLIWKDKPND